MSNVPLRGVPLNKLQLADVVELFSGAYGTGTVVQITADKVVIHRPYGLTQDFSYTSGVIFSVGMEVCEYLLSDPRFEFTVWQRKTLR